jgi:thiamine biosynthesis lipoprotein
MRRARPLLGTIVDISAEDAPETLPDAIEAAFASIEAVQRLMSFHDLDSDVSRINDAKAGEVVQIDPRTFHVLHFARQLSGLSAGAFDVTTASVLVRSGFLPERATEALPIGVTDLDLLPAARVRWRNKGWIDLGGIAKGFAVDGAIEVLCCHGVATAVVNAGGDLRCFGKPQPIHLRHPDMPTLLLYVGSLDDAAIATSAGYFSRKDSDGGQIEPLVDPKRHESASWNGSISVAAHDGRRVDQGSAPRTGPGAGDPGAVWRPGDRDRSGRKPYFGPAAAPGGTPGMTRPRQSPMRLSRWHERWLYAILCVLLSGDGWLADHYLFAGASDIPDAPAASESF